MLELSITKVCQYNGDENGFIRVEMLNKKMDGGKLKAYAKIESSYSLPVLVVWNNKFDNGITYEAGTKSFLFSDGSIAYQIV